MAGRAESPGSAAAEGREGGPGAVTITDEPVPHALRDRSDALGIAVSLLGVALTLLLASFARGTTTGLAQDVQGLEGVLRQFLIVPAAILERIVTLVVPLAVLAELLARRAARQAAMCLLAGVLGVVVCASAIALLHEFGSGNLVRGLSVVRDGKAELSVSVSLAMISALLTVAGPRRQRRSVAWSWYAVWVTVGVAVVTAQAGLLGSALALLLGRASGLTVRYALGVPTDRAYGDDLVGAVRRAGLEPVSIVRRPDDELRRYALVADDGRHFELTVLDGDRQAVALVSRMWEAVRFRQLGTPPLSARETAEHLAAVTSLVRESGVGAPAVHGVAVARDSTVIVHDGPAGAVPLHELAAPELTDDLGTRIWQELQRAHRRGVAHRRLSSRTVLVDAGARPRVWFSGWESGSIAASDLLRRVDLAQMLALLAAHAGVDRALESARSVLAPEELRALGPLLQPVALPRATREELRGRRELLGELRNAVVGPGPAADTEPAHFVRLGGRQAFTAIVAAVAVLAVLTTVNLRDIGAALTAADWRWGAAAFLLGLVTYVGVATTYVALAPERLPFWRTVQVQVAASFVAISAPAGLGPAGLNVRMFIRRGVAAARALATVALVQVSQFVVTVLLIVVLSVLSGASSAPIPTTSPALLLTLAAVVAAVGAALLVRPLRDWLRKRLVPVFRQAWPLFVTLGSHPRQLALAILGIVVTNLAWIMALYCSLAAFGEHRSLIQVTIVYFAGNAAGSVVPTPGGIGSVDVAIVAAMATLGLRPGVAVSATVLFRLATFWVQLPIGAAALRRLMRRGAL
ncbi:flippase-like domain-containing protein [Xylanimonas sp. McL0601]|uniref:flippase-like domain-containing protein n=1 Tax=Xylanimonas sp. McL0601 TaxID=3414739 RepID=UPI003CEFB034